MCEEYDKCGEWKPVTENLLGFDSEWGIYDPHPTPPTVTIYPEPFARLVMSHPKNDKKLLVRRGKDGIWREVE